jgi:(1->4)-alpha-D-glucan 1-alpha-D-glucosylmutase
LKLTVPGVPDIYQGCELWDLSLVDPDNRRPVDYDLRHTCLEQEVDPGTLLAHWRDGRIKQHVVALALALRRRQPELFEVGSYEPLQIAGSLGDRVVAFARRTEQATMIVIVPRLVAALLEGRDQPCPASSAWGDTRLELPAGLSGDLLDQLTGKPVRTASGSISVADALAELPVALLITA